MAQCGIQVHELRKIYTVHEREAGLGQALRSIARRTEREIAAVDGISFAVAPGEIVGFLGPNGAGKTTTLKMLSGLLYPSAGEVSVLGHVPWRREHDYLRQITLVMGQRQQLVWDIPASESFELNRAIYQIPRAQFRVTVDELVDLLDLAPLIGKQVRSLSLGERMKCEIAAALLHRPRVLFLDEPTIGLDGQLYEGQCQEQAVRAGTAKERRGGRSRARNRLSLSRVSFPLLSSASRLWTMRIIAQR